MAIAVGNEVALARTAGQTLTCNANFQFGRVNAGAGPFDVLWANGSFTTGVVSTLLDKIVGENASPKIYSFSDGFQSATPSNAYSGQIVRAYSRDNNGAGTLVDYVLIRCLQDGQLYEVPTAALVEQTGQ